MKKAQFFLQAEDYAAYYEAAKPHRGALNETAAGTFQGRVSIDGRWVAIGTFATEEDARVAIHTVCSAPDRRAMLNQRRPSAATAPPKVVLTEPPTQSAEAA